ncbi:hypothetical protein BDN72DRAFT_58913 [Pluteus cervinus]|uniref:Uncharacterized protein n=1 Tax=Pluteus cervinus TaxID=181527 RepID=A0ACD3ARI7_9AGAR|nr:hypothetical protein BDN72DRAFT_58913 [Pluteus cervinus]
MLLSLPAELLNQILEELEDEELYKLAWLCRTLNYAALDVLFQRHSPKLRDGTLALFRQPSYVVPALRGALSLVDRNLISVSISFGSPERLLPELKTLGEVIGSLKSLTNLYLNLSMAQYVQPRNRKSAWKGMDPIAFTAAFQNLVNVALEKGCRQVNVNNSWGLEHPQKNNRPFGALWDKPEKKKRNGVFTTTFVPMLRRSLGKLGLKSHKSKVKPDPPIAKVAADETMPEAKVVQQVYYPVAKDLSDINIGAEMFFEPTWIDWTLHICNTASLTRFQLYTFGFKTIKDWDYYLPKLHLTHLKDFIVCGDVSNLENLCIFLQRHSPLLEEVLLNLPAVTAASLSESTSNSGHLTGGSFAENQQVMELGFPKLDKVFLTPGFAQWFINWILATSSVQNGLPLPSLHHVSILAAVLPSTPTTLYHTDLTNALTVLAKLVTLVKSSPPSHVDSTTTSIERRQSQKKWFSDLFITCGAMRELVPWLKSCHPSDSQAGEAIRALTCVEHLTLSADEATANNDEFLNALPCFLGHFPGLKRLIIYQMKFDQVKRLREREYWKRVKTSCPLLERWQFKMGVELSIDKLITGNWTEQDIPPHARSALGMGV